MIAQLLQPLQIESLSEFKANAARWDALWTRSTAENPTLRSESIALWSETFASDQPFHVTAVVDPATENWLAAILLLGSIKMRHLHVGVLPTTTSAALLVDANESAEEAMGALIDAVRSQTSFQWVWPENVRLHGFDWALFQRVLGNQGIAHESLQTHETAVIVLEGSFDDMLQTWDREKNKEVKRLFRKLHELGQVELAVVTSEKEFGSRLSDCFKIEDEGWKGNQPNGLSIHRRGHERFFEEQARILARSGFFFLFGLVVDGTWIAFQYDYAAKHTMFCHKIGYAPDFRKYSPGFVLHHMICEFLRANRPDINRFDYVGEFMNYQSHWNPLREPVGQIVLPTRSLLGKVEFRAYRRIMPLIRNRRRRLQSSALVGQRKP
jgi:hypothetical protein